MFILIKDMLHHCFECLEGLTLNSFLDCTLKVEVLLDCHVFLDETCLLHHLNTLLVVSTQLKDMRFCWPEIIYIHHFIFFIVGLDGSSNLIGIFKTNVTETLTKEDFLILEKVFLFHGFEAV